MMRRIATLMHIMVLTCILVSAAPITFINSEPANGSEITTFDIKLKFDVSETAQKQGTTNLGLQYIGDSYGCTYLYEGTEENGKLLDKIWEDCKVIETEQSENTLIVKLPISTSIVPEPGKSYTVVCRNEFDVLNLDNGRVITGALIDYYDVPLVLTFTGVQASSNELVYQKSSIENNQNLEKISTVDFEFNEEFEILDKNGVQIWYDNQNVYSPAQIQVNPEKKNALQVQFNDAILYLGNTYTIKLNPGTVCLKGNTYKTNSLVEIHVIGTSTKYVSIKSVYPQNNSVLLPTSAEIRFNLEDGLTLTPPGSVLHNRDIGFYKGEISDENLIETLRGTASGDGITWDLSTYQFEPEERYSLCLKPDGITVWLNGKSQPAYGNEEVIITFTTPSVKDAGFSPIEFGPTVISAASSDNEATYEDNLKRAYLSNMIVSLKDKYYYYGDQKCSIHVSPDFEYKTVCNLYEITSEGDRLIKSYSFASRLQEDAKSIWMTQVVRLNTPLYEGKTYKFVVPEGYFTAYPDIYIQGVNTNDLSKINFIRSEELVYTFEGTTPTNIVLLECNVPDNSVSSSIGKVVWKFDGLYRIGENVRTIEVSVDFGTGMKPMISQKIPSIATDSGKTFVTLDFISNTTGLPTSIPEGVTYTLTIPSGLLVNSVNDEMTNDEIILTIKGGKETSSAPEFVNVNLSINGMHTASHPAIKGKPYTLKLDPGTDWKVESVMNGDKVLTEQALAKSTYVFTPTADSNINATLAYDGDLATEITADIWEITDKSIRIYRDNNQIVVDGVTPSNTINIYSVSGILITSIHVTDGNDRVNITVPSGQIYIVSVDGVAAKISMKN